MRRHTDLKVIGRLSLHSKPPMRRHTYDIFQNDILCNSKPPMRRHTLNITIAISLSLILSRLCGGTLHRFYIDYEIDILSRLCGGTQDY